MKLTLEDKVVVVTGAGQGQGFQEVQELIKHGANVYACDVQWPNTLPESDQLRQITMDVSSEAAWTGLADQIRTTIGRVDGLVNNAAMNSRTPIGQVTSAEMDRVLAVNLKGPLFAIQSLAPLMGQGASIVNVGSIAAVSAFGGVAYTSSKWALRGLTRVASMHYGADGIRANLVNPGLIETPMTASILPTFRETVLRSIPLNRLGLPADLANVVLFLLSDEAAYVSGAEINVDGGYAGHVGAKPGYDTWNVRG
ncbi:SDR family NAD(P)-dependent oxidoreductase [Pedococcus sp. P5_B7]